MIKWIAIEDELPEDGQEVYFKLHGYEFIGKFMKGKNSAIFCGNQGNGGLVTTLEATHWRVRI